MLKHLEPKTYFIIERHVNFTSIIIKGLKKVDETLRHTAKSFSTFARITVDAIFSILTVSGSFSLSEWQFGRNVQRLPCFQPTRSFTMKCEGRWRRQVIFSNDSFYTCHKHQIIPWQKHVCRSKHVKMSKAGHTIHRCCCCGHAKVRPNPPPAALCTVNMNTYMCEKIFLLTENHKTN